jgi:hypothetical protein
MLHACVQRFDVTGNLEKFSILGRTKQGLICVALGRRLVPATAAPAAGAGST